MIGDENIGAGESVGMGMVPAPEKMAVENKPKCLASIVFGDDFGDNSCTFHCQLDEGHEGKHVEAGDQGYGRIPHPYRIEWEGDSADLNKGF